MLITRKHKSFVEKYFINFLNRDRAKRVAASQDEYLDYDAEMYGVIEKVIDFYAKDAEKSLFIKRYIIEKRSWKDACINFHIERRTYFQWKDEILSDAVICAVLNNLMDLDVDMTDLTTKCSTES